MALRPNEIHNMERMFLEYTHRLLDLYATKADHERDIAIFRNTEQRVQNLKNRTVRNHKRTASRNKNFLKGISNIQNTLGDRKSTMRINNKGKVLYHIIPYSPTQLVLRKMTIHNFNKKEEFKVTPKTFIQRKSILESLLKWRGSDPYMDSNLECSVRTSLLNGKVGNWSYGPLFHEGASVIISRDGPKWFVDAVFKEYSAAQIKAQPKLKYCSARLWEESGILYKEGEHIWNFPNPRPPIPRIDSDSFAEYNSLIDKHLPHLRGIYPPYFQKYAKFLPLE